MSIAQQPTAVVTWNVDPVHSNVGFAVKHMVVSTFRGRFERYDARLTEDGGRLSLTGTVDVDSIVVKNPALEGHLQGPEFFDAERHPQLSFASTSIDVADDGAAVVAGDLTIRGTTLPVRAEGSLTEPVDDPYGDIRRALQVETVIDRRAYGLEWNMPLPRGGFALDNEVRLQIDLELVKA